MTEEQRRKRNDAIMKSQKKTSMIVRIKLDTAKELEIYKLKNNCSSVNEAIRTLLGV